MTKAGHHLSLEKGQERPTMTSQQKAMSYGEENYELWGRKL